MSKLIVGAFVFSLTSGTRAATIRVPADHPAVQGAIDAAADGDTVLVAPGEYVLAEPLSLEGKRIVVRSEQGAGETILRMSPASPEAERTSVVVFESGEGRESILDGFTLTGGRGTRWGNDFLERGGGGIACRTGTSPTVRNCEISGNSSDKGGGIYCAPGSTSLFQRTRISGNTLAGFFGSPSGGAGVYVAAEASPVFEDCEVSGNSSANPNLFGSGVVVDRGAASFSDSLIAGNTPGYGIVCGTGSLDLRRCKVSGNSLDAPGEGGGVSVAGETTIRIAECAIEGNAGAGIVCQSGGTAEVTSSEVRGNLESGIFCIHDGSATLRDTRVTRNDGGVRLRFGSSLVLEGCVIWQNAAAMGGGLTLGESSRAEIRRSTIAGNAASRGGGAACDGDSTLIVESSIVWDNAGGGLLLLGGSTAEAAFSSIEADSPWPGEGNIASDPLFVGWGDSPETVHVDDRRSEPGAGTELEPYQRLASALDGFRLELAEGSPAIGSGKDGSDMGAPLGRGGPAGVTTRTVRIAHGFHPLDGYNLAHRVSIVGTETSESGLIGTVFGLRTGSRLARVRVSGGASHGGVQIPAGESPLVSECLVMRNSGVGITCGEGSSPRIERSTIMQNSGGDGGGVFLRGSKATVSECLVDRNTAGLRGGGILCVDGADATIDRVQVSRNIVGGGGPGGGGIACFGSSAVFSRCRILENSCPEAGGGGVSATGSAIILDSWIFSNAADVGGGLSLGGEAMVINCAVFGNASLRQGGGAAFLFESAVLLHSTLTGNSAGHTLLCQGDTPEIRNSILDGVAEDSRCVDLAGNLRGADPLFLKPGAYDFGTFRDVDVGDTASPRRMPDFVLVEPDLQLREGSPAIDAGRITDESPENDISGNPRSCGPNPDLGAFEACALSPARFVRCDPNGDGRNDIADGIWILNELFRGGPATRCRAAGDCQGDGLVDASDAMFAFTFQLRGGSPPPPPFPACGSDDSGGDLDCVEPPDCVGGTREDESSG